MKKIKYIIISIFIFFIFSLKVNADTPSIQYSSHVQFKGWMDYVNEGKMSGSTGESLRLEAIKIKLINASGSIQYRTHVQFNGWMNYVNENEVSGTTGELKRVEAIQIRLTGDIANKYDIYYRAHVECIGWQDWVKNDEVAGTTGESKRLEAIEIKLVAKQNTINEDTNKSSIEEDKGSVNLKYKSYVKEKGWQDYVNNNEISGTTGENRSIQLINILLENTTKYNGSVMYSIYTSSNGWQEYKNSNEDIGTKNENIVAIRIKLTDNLSSQYDIYYRSHVSYIGWLSWTKNDGISGTTGYFNSIEAIQIMLVEKNSNTKVDTSGLAHLDSNNNVEYSSHVAFIGWMNYVKDGELSGTTGESKAVEAIKIKLNNNLNSSIVCESYVATKGWQTAKSNDEICGTTGESKALEAVKISINGTLSDYYDVYYRTHISNIGWLDWAKNGEKSGSIGSDTQIEAIEIKLVKKGLSAPGSTSKPYVTGKWNGNDYTNYFGQKVYGFKFIDGVKYYFNSEGTLIGKNVKEVIDVSSWQGVIDWDKVKKTGVDAVILRVGWGMSYSDAAGTDSQFDRNIKELKRLNIPYSIYIYGYAKVDYAAQKEAKFVIDMMKKYSIPKDTFVWYDAEINSIPLSTYQIVIPTFINYMKSNGYNNVGVYGSLNSFIASYGNLNDANIRSYPLWVAQYYKKIQYPGSYVGWQFTSDGSIDGINGRVDVSMFY